MNAPRPRLLSSWQRRLLFFLYIAAIGWLCNELTPKPAQTMPFLLGNMAITLLAQRLGFRWGLLALVLVMWPIPDWGLRLFASVHLVLAIWLHKQPWRFWQRLSLLTLLLLPLMLALAKPTTGTAMTGLWFCNSAILLFGLLNSELGALLIIRVVESTRGTPQPFNRVLANRLTVATVTPLSIAALFALDLYVDRTLDQSADRLQRHAEHQANQISQHVQQHRIAIAGHAGSLRANDDSRFPRTLSVLATSFPGFLTLLITDSDGRIISSYPPTLTSPQRSVADRDYFRVPQRTLQAFISGVFQGRGFGNDAIVAISAPVLDDNARFHGVLEGSLNLTQLGSMLIDDEPSRGARSVLLDSDRTVIASSLVEVATLSRVPVYFPALSPFDTTRIDDDEYHRHLNASSSHLLAAAQVPFSSWSLLALHPYFPMAEQFAQLTALTILACLAIMLASRLFAASFSRVIAAPLDDLLVRIRALNLDSPDTLHPVTTQTSISELQELTQDFNQLVLRQTTIYGELRSSLALLDATNQELEQRVQERTVELVTARDEAQQMASAKSAFLANMSHELRTPLTAIIGFSERALLQLHHSSVATHQSGVQPGSYQEALTIIARNAKHLLRLVNDILDASKLEFDKLELEQQPLSPLQLITDVIASMKPQATTKGIRLDWHPKWPLPEQVLGDSTRLKQVLFNIVGNAIKFTERGGVTLLLAADHSGQEWQIEIRDTGVGLSPEQQQRLFQPFIQADASTTRKFGGSGLGLYISRQLILRMGGTFLLQSAIGQGSHFVITLPTHVEPPNWLMATPQLAGHDSAPEAVVDSVCLRGKVLLAEDVDDLRTLITMLVAETGAEVVAVDNGQKAIDAAAATAFDLVLMDMHMPVLDGLSAVQHLRAQNYRGSIVALTADVMESDVERFRQAGCEQVLAKPIDRQRLLAVLRQFLATSDQTEPPPTPVAELARETAQTAQPSSASATGETAAAAPTAAPVSAGIAALLAQLSQQFLARVPSDIAGLQQELAAADWSQMQSRLHKLKGAAGTFGFPAISQRADKVYRLLQQQDWQAARAELAQLMAELSQLGSPPAAP